MGTIVSTIFLFILSYAHALQLYSDTWVDWTPVGKPFDIVCFDDKGAASFIRNVEITALDRHNFSYKTTEGDRKGRSSLGCFFEQKTHHPVARDEFFENIVSINCDLYHIPFTDGDFRVLGTNPNTTSIKRLRDGKVWIVPTKSCTVRVELPKRSNLVNENQKVIFPGEIDQIKTPEYDEGTFIEDPPEKRESGTIRKFLKALP